MDVLFAKRIKSSVGLFRLIYWSFGTAGWPYFILKMLYRTQHPMVMVVISSGSCCMVNRRTRQQLLRISNTFLTTHFPLCLFGSCKPSVQEKCLVKRRGFINWGFSRNVSSDKMKNSRGLTQIILCGRGKTSRVIFYLIPQITLTYESNYDPLLPTLTQRKW